MNPMPVAQPSGQPELTLRSTANVWGKKSTPAAAAPTPMAPSTNSFANTTNKASPIRIQSILLLPAVTVGVGVHQLMVAPVVMVGTGLVSQLQRTSRASETAERIQKEKMGAALFGGISATQPPAPPPPSAATSPAINTTPGGQWGWSKACRCRCSHTNRTGSRTSSRARGSRRLIYLVLMHHLNTSASSTVDMLAPRSCGIYGQARHSNSCGGTSAPEPQFLPFSSCRSCRSICRCRPLRWHKRHSHHSFQPMVLILRSMNLKAVQSLL